MGTYSVNLQGVPKGHSVSPLLAQLGEFVKTQEHGSLGWFDAMNAEAVPPQWSQEHAARLAEAAFTFLQLADGSLVAQFKTGPVVLLGSEGETATLGERLEDFILAWSKGETGVGDLDDGPRPALATWASSKNLKPSTAEAFDFAGWLSGETAAEVAPVMKPPMVGSETFSKLGPKLRAAAEVVGRRADDEQVIAYVTTLKKKTPKTASAQSVWVEAPKAGLNLLFGHEIANDAFPPISKTSKSFVPSIFRIDVKETVGEDVLGLSWKAKSANEVEAVLGPATEVRSEFMNKDRPTIPVWKRTLDSEGQVELIIEFDRALKVSMVVPSARVLRPFGLAAQSVFVGWAITQGLFDESRFPAHNKLFNDVKKRKKNGGDFVNAALPRGLWDDHLKNVPGLRRMAYQWFHNMNELSMSADFKEVFGPSLVSSGWDAVNAADQKLKDRFAKYL